MNDANLKESAWQDFFARLKRGEIPDDQIGPAIVHLAKPFDAARIETAKDTILTFLNHQNAWARHEAMWFIRWANLIDHTPALIEALKNDPDSDNRRYAAICLAHLLQGTSDHDAIKELSRIVLEESEDSLVRVDCYGALVEMLNRENGSKYFGEPSRVEAIDLDWVRSLSR